MIPIRRRRLAAVAVAGLICGLIVWLLFGRSGALSQPGLPPAQSVYETVSILLQTELEDQPNWSKRQGSHLTQLVNQSVLDRMFPVSFAGERVFLLGDQAIAPLLRIVDESTDKQIVQKAWYILVEFDDPRVLQQIRAHLELRKLTPFEAGWLLSVYLPIDRSSSHLVDDRVEEWLEVNRKLSYEELCLKLLDEMMKSDSEVSHNRFKVRRWLNRHRDTDLDEWLSQKAPEALTFRNRELSRGYDPVVSFSRLSDSLREGIRNEGAKALFADTESQSACEKLLDAAYGYDADSPLTAPPAKGWERRVRDWYAQSRNQLKYDRTKHRFVVSSTQTPDR